MLTRVLCATDLSPASGPAWDFAQRLALAAKTELLLLHVIPLIPLPMEGPIDPRIYQRILEEDRLQALAACDRLAGAAGDRGLRVSVRLESGPAAQRILEAAEQGHTDLVVLGTHGRRGLNRLLLGSVAEHVVQLSLRPVVTARPLPGTGRPLEGPFARIVYPTDFSPAARKAWPWAKALAEATGAEVDLLHVLLEVVPDRHLDVAFLEKAAAAIRADAQKSADRFLERCGLPPDRVHVHLGHGEEVDQIVRWAERRSADLIVMGTHGRTGILRLALGSVARRMLHAAPCPVLTVGHQIPES